MCFVIHESCPEARTATENIPCHKLLEREGHNIVSPCQRYLYFKNSAGIELRAPWKWFQRKKKTFKAEMVENMGNIYQGLHSFMTSTCVSTRYNRQLHDAYIPKGALYYIDTSYGEYVSNQLVVYRKPLK